MFNRYFGNKVKYEEIYTDENGDIRYKQAKNVDGTLIELNKRYGTGEWLHNRVISYRKVFRVSFKPDFGSKLDGDKVIYVRPIYGFGKLEFYQVSTIGYEDILVNEADLTMECIVERKTGVDSLRTPVYGEPETVKTWIFDNRVIYKPNESGVITSHSARGYVLITSVDIKKGDKIDGYIVEEIDLCPSVHGTVDHIEAYVCKG